TNCRLRRRQKRLRPSLSRKRNLKNNRKPSRPQRENLSCPERISSNRNNLEKASRKRRLVCRDSIINNQGSTISSQGRILQVRLTCLREPRADRHLPQNDKHV